jgi:hypothetical protein
VLINAATTYETLAANLIAVLLLPALTRRTSKFNESGQRKGGALLVMRARRSSYCGLPKGLMHSRRLMGFTPWPRTTFLKSLVRCSSESYCTALQQKKRTHVRFGSKADMAL